MLAKPDRDISHIVVAGDIQFDLYRHDWEPGENRIYEPEIINAIMQFVKPGDFCIDAGANLGYHTILMSKLVGNKGEVLAFEPDPNFYTKLNANLELNHIENVLQFPIALWSGVNAMTFWVIDDPDSKYGGLSSFVKYGYPPSHPVMVTTRTLDSLIHPAAHVRFLKIDCEGAEEHILRGAENTLRRGVDCVIVEFNYKVMPFVGTSDRIIRDYMNSLGYDLFFLHRDGKIAPSYIGPELNITVSGEGFAFNGMFAKRKMVEELWGGHVS